MIQYKDINHAKASQLCFWICALLQRTQMRLYVITAALDLLIRLRKREILMPREVEAYELFLVACMVAHKANEDAAFNARAWAQAAQGSMMTERIVEVERDFLDCMDWRVQSDFEELTEIGEDVFGQLILRNETFAR